MSELGTLKDGEDANLIQFIPIPFEFASLSALFPYHIGVWNSLKSGKTWDQTLLSPASFPSHTKGTVTLLGPLEPGDLRTSSGI